MVDGKLECIGSVQHLKAKFGDGYTLTVKIRENHRSLNKTTDEEFEHDDEEANNHDLGHSNHSRQPTTSSSTLKIKASKNRYINLIFNELKEKICNKCKLKKRHFNNVYQFELPYPNSHNPEDKDLNFNIGDIYKLIESNKLRFNIADYSLSQSTLDNVFINFIKEQTSKGKGTNSQDPNDDDENDDSDHTDNDDKNHKINPQKRNKSADKFNDVQFPIHDSDDLLIDTNIIESSPLKSVTVESNIPSKEPEFKFNNASHSAQNSNQININNRSMNSDVSSQII